MKNVPAIAILISSLLIHAPGQQAPAQQSQPSAEPQQMPGMNAPPLKPHMATDMTDTQQPPSGPMLRLEDLERIGLANNPTLRQADAELRATEGRKRQAGLYPNPTIGYEGEEIRGGSLRGGQQGAFIQQDIVLGGKLGAARNVVEQERRQAQAERDEQRLRVLNGIRIAYYQALAAQETVVVRTNLLKLAQDAVATSKQLFNVGQSDQPDVLQAEIEADQAVLALTAAQQNQQRLWKSLAAVVGHPALPLSQLVGTLEELPTVDTDEWLEKLLTDSPAIKIAQLEVTRADAQLSRARREPIPNLQLRAGVEQNRELLETTNRPIGLQGFAEAGIRIPLFNRNQGNIEAAKADLDRAQRETQRVQLLLQERLASTVQAYLTAKAAAERYRTQMIPRAESAYKLYLEKYNNMTAAYPQVVIAQRTLFQLRADYVMALESAWVNSIALRGFMLTDALEAPTSPREMDRPVRETNLPSRSPAPQM